MTNSSFHAAFKKAIDALREAGIQNFVLIAYDPSNDGATGAAAANSTSAADTTALFHSASEVMLPEFAKMNGLPSPAAAEAMRELVYMAEAAHREKLAAARQFDANFPHVVLGAAMPEG